MRNNGDQAQQQALAAALEAIKEAAKRDGIEFQDDEAHRLIRSAASAPKVGADSPRAQEAEAPHAHEPPKQGPQAAHDLVSKPDTTKTHEDAAAAQGSKKPKAHYHGHRQRLKDKFLTSVREGNGESMADYEVLELILFLAIPQKDVKPLAKDLLDRFGGLGGVLSARPDALMAIPGIKEGAAIALKAVHVAAARALREEVQNKPILSTWERLLDYCHTMIAHREIEEFHLLFLDRKNRLIWDERQQRGTVDQAPIYAREVVKRALELHACAVIMVHNHPSGDPQPSPNDIKVTHKIHDALRHVDIVLHDHLIFSRTGYCSFKSDGFL